MLRNIILASIIVPVFGLAGSAIAQTEVTDDQTAPIDSGTAGDIIVRSGGSVLIGSGTAVVIDSDNTLLNEGTIGSLDTSNTTGVLLTGGTTGSLNNTGSISLTEDITNTDDDNDGDLDGTFAQGSGRVGILIEGPAAFMGNVSNDTAGRIVVEGNNSAAIRILSGLDGDLTNDGTITIVGNDSYGIQVSSTVNGDVSSNGIISVSGENSVGLSVDAQVNGTVTNTGQISATGFRETTRRNSVEERDKLDSDDLLQGGSAVSITANVAGGFINGILRDTDGNATRTGAITSQGAAPAVLISAGLDTDPGGDVTLGAVGATADDQDWGLINDGTIVATGVNDGFATTAVRVQGQEFGGVMRRAIIERGILNSGTVSASGFDASARAIWIGNGADVGTIRNHGQIRSAITSQVGGQSIGIAVDAGSQVSTISNTNTIQAQYTGSGTGAQAVAIYDASGNVDLVQNQGLITAVYSEILPDGEEVDPNDTTRHAVSIDLSNNTTGATVRQIANSDSSITPAIVGDIILGSGNDTVTLDAGRLDGDVVFGDGEDLLTIDNGAELTGALYDSDGLLTLDVRDGLLALGADTTLNLTSATFGSDARLQMTLANSATGITGATFNTSGTVMFLDGAVIAPILTELVGNGGSFSFLQAGTLGIQGSLDALLDSEQLPYLYNVSLRQGAAGDTLVLDLQRRTASELGFDTNQTAVYDAWFSALSSSTDSALEGGFAQLTNQDDFFGAYNQLLPEFGAAALQFTLANTDGATGAIATRLDNVRRGYGPQGGMWAQEIGYYLTRNLSSISQPYRGFGLGMAIGIDRPLGPLDAIGIAVSGFSNEIKQPGGFDKPLTSRSAQIGVYGGSTFGNLNFESNASIGVDTFDSERVLQFGDVARTTTGGWGGNHVAGTARLSYDITSGKWYIRPSASLDYLRLKEKAYTEVGGGAGIDLDINSRLSKSFSGSATVSFGRKFSRPSGSWWSPQLRVGVRNEFQGNAASTVARFSGFTDEFTLTPQQLPDTAVLLGFSFAAGSRFTSFGFDYDADIRNGFVRHTGRLVIRFIF